MKTQEHSSSNRKAIMYLILFIALIGLGITGYYMNKGNSSEGTVPGQVWSEEHQHWH